MTYLSPDAMRDARIFMNSDQKGVRDEIGFLIVHQRYADRFFPGTSVLHTRLRYVLFVPWLYRDEHLKPAKGQRAQESVKRREYGPCPASIAFARTARGCLGSVEAHGGHLLPSVWRGRSDQVRRMQQLYAVRLLQVWVTDRRAGCTCNDPSHFRVGPLD